jgi:hypothetical protein
MVNMQWKPEVDFFSRGGQTMKGRRSNVDNVHIMQGQHQDKEYNSYSFA